MTELTYVYLPLQNRNVECESKKENNRYTSLKEKEKKSGRNTARCEK